MIFDGDSNDVQVLLNDKRASDVTQCAISRAAMETVPDSDELPRFMGIGQMTGISQRWFIDSFKHIVTR
jgi:hypothetical protein